MAKSLYDNATGTTGTITLSESAANFSFLDIYALDANGAVISVKVISPNGKKAILSSALHTDTGYYSATLLNISGTSITQSYNKQWYSNTSVANKVKVIRVDGYK